MEFRTNRGMMMMMLIKMGDNDVEAGPMFAAAVCVRKRACVCVCVV